MSAINDLATTGNPVTLATGLARLTIALEASRPRTEGLSLAAESTRRILLTLAELTERNPAVAPVGIAAPVDPSGSGPMKPITSPATPSAASTPAAPAAAAPATSAPAPAAPRPAAVASATPQAPGARASLVAERGNTERGNTEQGNVQPNSNGGSDAQSSGSGQSGSSAQAGNGQQAASSAPSKSTKAPAAPRRPAKSQVVALPSSRIGQVSLSAGTLPLLLLGLVAVLGMLLVLAGTRRGILPRKS